MHAEIKEWNSWKHALGQLIAYNTEDPKQNLRIYFFGNCTMAMKDIAASIIQQNRISVYQCEIQDNTCFVTDYSTGETVYRYIVDLADSLSFETVEVPL